MQVAQKIRLKPTKSQIEKFLQFSGTARFTYNECLAYKISQYKHRIYHCNWCGAELDRDFNASKNLEKYYEERKSQKAS